MEAEQTLADRVLAEVSACIGCHDCMLACPLPQAVEVTIAELNAAVHEPVIQSPHVARFLAACTQCRQCVPACPADLSRADMVLFNKMKVEDAVPDQVLWLQVGTRVVPSPFTLDALAMELPQIQIFAGIPPADLRRLLLRATVRALAPGEELCREGSFYERLTIVLGGALEQTSADGYGRRTRILVLGPGSFFGEMAIMADHPEPFTVTATMPTHVVELPKAAVHRLMAQSPTFQRTMNELYSRRALWTYAKRSTAIGGLPEQAMNELLLGAELDLVSAGAPVLREGDAPADVYLVRSGFLKVSRALPGSNLPAVLVYFREGDFFGALPLLLDEPAHCYSVEAQSRAELIRIRGAVLRQVLARYPGARAPLLAGALEVERVARAPRLHYGAGGPSVPPPPNARPSAINASVVQPLSFDVLVGHGVLQGREVLVVDQTRCTHCNGCVDACGRRHGHSRLQLRGLQVEHLLFPTACRHCEDPVCLLCSVNGIVRLPTGEITIVKDSCIGCGACAERCPYGNISMHPATPPKRGLFAGVFEMLLGSRADEAADVHDPKAPRVAVKCDLCAGYDDYACVSACPVGAAFRIDPKDEAGRLIGLEMRGTAGAGQGQDPRAAPGTPGPPRRTGA
jgi:CRP-like cAMP-binding protein/Fe-S-cluster-containing hydrogenase component 2